MPPLSSDYWNHRYLEHNTPWDIGQPSPPLMDFVQQTSGLDANARILLPGAGHGHEAILLRKLGFEQVYVCDWAERAFEHLLAAMPDFPREHLLVQDFFSIDTTFDLLLEQTFFCAILPAMRSAYARKCFNLLRPGGRLAGVLFASHFPFQGPPFGGTHAEYLALFKPYFEIERLGLATNSIGPRAGNEIWLELRKPVAG
jgi:SAM-dependent methyltransferase